MAYTNHHHHHLAHRQSSIEQRCVLKGKNEREISGEGPGIGDALALALAAFEITVRKNGAIKSNSSYIRH